MQQQITEGFHLSPQQERRWRWRESLGNRAAFILRIRGALDPERLRTALDRLAGELEILRTAYPLPESMRLPLQVIGEGGLVWTDPLDARGDTAEQAAERLWAAVDENDAPRARLAILAEDDALLLIDLPGLSADLDAPELAAAAIARVYGDGEPRADGDEEPLQYADIAEWMNDNLEQERAEGEDWRDIDVAPGERLTLPFERAAEDAFEPLTLAVPGSERWGERCAAAGLDSRAATAAAWLIALSRASGEAAPQIGCYGNGRAFEQLAGAFGPLGQFLPLQAAIDSERSFRILVEALRSRLDDLHASQHHFFPQLFEGGVKRSGPRYGFAYLADPPDDGDAGQPRFLPFARRIHLEPFAACLRSETGDGRRRAWLECNGAVWSQDRARALVDRVAVVFERALSRPDAPLAHLDALTDEERNRLLIDFNRVETNDPATAGQTLPRLFEAQARRTPDAPAVLCEDGRLTFDQLNRRANQLAHALRARGCGAETRAAICLPRSVEMMVAVWGALKAGATYLPLEPDDPPERMAYILEHGQAAVAIVHGADAPAFPAGLDLIDLASFDFSAFPDANPENAVDPDQGAYMIYTSGSTGRPKGVLIAHHSPVNLRVAMHKLVYADLPEGPRRISMNAPLSFDASMQQICMMTLGHCLCIVPRETRFDGAAFAAWIRETGVEVLDITPAHLTALVDAGLLMDEPPALKRIQVAGGVIHQKLWDCLAGAKARFFDIYGPTECTVNATGEPILQAGVAPSIGPPLANYRVYLTDQGLIPVPDGATGQIAIGGSGLARGYAARPELTAVQFVPDPFGDAPGQRLYLSGDAARHLEDGRLAFVGRIDRQLKIRGYRVELGEIENALARHPGVSRCAVLARPAEGGAGELQLAAYYEPAGEAPEPVELQRFLQGALPYYMIPALFAALPSLPITANGKIDLKALPDPSEIRGGDRTPPRDDVEAKLAGIWSEQLGVADIGVFDDFYSLGGHSLLLLSTIGKMNERFAGQITLAEFFEEPTIAAIAEKLRAAESSALHSAEAAALLDELGGLSEDEIRAMLAQEKSAP